MAIISKKYRFIYALAPRTASTATANYLIKHYEASLIPKEDVLDPLSKARVDKKHSSFKELLDFKIIGEEELKSLLTFITIRNPFNSLYSLWYKKKYTYVPLLEDKNSWVYKNKEYAEDMLFLKDKGFDEWIAHSFGELASSGKKRKLDAKFRPHCNYTLRFEFLNDDLKALFKLKGIPYFGPIPVLNKTVGREANYRKEYSSESKVIVEKVFADDLNEFNYEF